MCARCGNGIPAGRPRAPLTSAQLAALNAAEGTTVDAAFFCSDCAAFVRDEVPEEWLPLAEEPEPYVPPVTCRYCGDTDILRSTGLCGFHSQEQGWV